MRPPTNGLYGLNLPEKLPDFLHLTAGVITLRALSLQAARPCISEYRGCGSAYKPEHIDGH